MNLKTCSFILIGLLVASCNNNDELDPISKGEDQTLSIKLSTPTLGTRAIEDPINEGVEADYETVTLYFWKDANKKIPADSRPSIQLSKNQISEAKEKGTKINISTDVTSVSMTANTAKKEGKGDYSILKMQNLGSDFTKQIPMTSPTVEPSTSSSKPNAKEVELKPVPDLARIEVMGKITPKPNSKTKKSAYQSVIVEAVHLNNYKASSKASELTLKTDKEDWNNYEPLLHDKELTAIANKTKAAAYQFFPCKNERAEDDNLVHIVLKIKYTKNDESSSQVNNRWITISKYKEGLESLKEFKEGAIYKLDLASLNELFGTDDEGNIIDPTDPTPETPKTDLYVKVKAYSWTTHNITPDL